MTHCKWCGPLPVIAAQPFEAAARWLLWHWYPWVTVAGLPVVLWQEPVSGVVLDARGSCGCWPTGLWIYFWFAVELLFSSCVATAGCNKLLLLTVCCFLFLPSGWFAIAVCRFKGVLDPGPLHCSPVPPQFAGISSWGFTGF